MPCPSASLVMTRLPIELWLNIISHYTNDDRETAKSLCLVSTRLLPLARSILYSNLLRKDLRKAALLHTLSDGPNATTISGLVREIALENCLRLERLNTPENAGQVAALVEHDWTALDVAAAQAAVQARWDRTAAAIWGCTGVTKMTFVLDCEDARAMMATSTFDDDSPVDTVPVPSATSAVLTFPRYLG